MKTKPTFKELEDRIKVLENEVSKSRQEEEALHNQISELNTHVRQQDCIISLSRLLERHNITIAEILKNTVHIIPLAFEYPESICVRILYKGQEFRTDDFKETRLKQTTDIYMYGNPACSLELYYLAERTEEEKGLLKFIAEQLGNIMECVHELEALKKTASTYYRIFKNIQDVYYEVTIDGIILELSPSIRNVSGYTREELLGEPLHDIYVDPEERDHFVKKILEDGKVTDYEVRLRDKNGSHAYCSINAKIERDNKDTPIRIVGSLRNITKRKQIEKALRESETQKKAILDASLDRIRYTDEDMRILWSNQTSAKGIGMLPENLVGKLCYEVFCGRDTPCVGCSCIASLKSNQIERNIVCKSNVKGTEEDTYWDMYCVPLKIEGETDRRFIQIARDITAQKKATDLLQKSEETLMAILTASPIGIGFVKDRRVIWTNKALTDMLGYENGSLSGIDIKKFYRNGEEYEHVGRMLYSEADEKGIGKVETSWLRKEGGVIDCYLQSTPIDPFNPSKGHIVAAIDITERKMAEKRIRSLTRQVMNIQENERERIARELHDHVAQDLSTLNMACKSLFHKQADINQEVMGKVSEFSQMIENIIVSLRELAYNLRPATLKELGFLQTIYRYCKDFCKQNGITLNFKSAGMKRLKLDFDTEINLYRIVQEALNNVLKHADASVVSIRLIVSFPNIILRITDDGKGFNIKEQLSLAKNQKRMGLLIMEGRVNLLGGEMTIKSFPTEGTKISIKIPLPERTDG
ncbi:MAG: PAS domain S-box protein [Pseudomonadota bacterium]